MPKRKISYMKRSVFWPCGDCRLNCSKNAVQCDSCNSWYHYHCQLLSLSDVEFLVNGKDSNFSCLNCLKEEIGATYSFSSGLLRLHTAAQRGYDALVYAAKRELQVFPKEKMPDSVHVDQRNLGTDFLTQVIVHQQSMSVPGVPKSTTPDGNCLFHAISLSLYGTEEFSTEIRMRTCVQMCLHPQLYKNRKNFDDLLILSPSFEDSTLDCSKSTAYSSVWTMMAAADALGVSISSIYPPVNGRQDLAFKVLNDVFDPSTECQPTARINIMWTHSEIASNPSGTWTPNHFVPIFTDSATNISFAPESYSSPIVKQTTGNNKPETAIYESFGNKSLTNDANDNNLIEETSVGFIHLDSEQHHAEVSDNIESNTLPEETNKEEFNTPTGVNKLQGPKFMSAREIFGHLTKKETIIFDQCPPGNKSNTWFLVRNMDNTFTCDNKRTYFDDCGTWDTTKGRTHLQDYLLSDNFRVIFNKNGKYCLKQRQKGQVLWIPLEPQPLPTDVVTMHRYETALKTNSDFKKHVSWFSSGEDSTMCHLALYEYLGTYHIGSENNIRTHPNVIKKIRTDFINRKPKEVYFETNKDDSMNAAKNTKQIKNAQYRQKKNTQTVSRNNIADEILEVLSMMNDHPFVQQVLHKKGQVPSIICYTEDQMTDFKMFLSKGVGTVGVDRTFNLGSFFVTAIVYKQLRVTKRDTKDHPIFIGPMLLHKDASYKSYFTFFSHIACEVKINNIELRIPEQFDFGSDDEKAVTKAIEDVFPHATRRLCTKHLKDNMKFYLQNKIGVEVKERNHLMDLIFSNDGIVNADNTIDFEERSNGFKEELEKYPRLRDYFTNNFKSRIQKFVNEPRRNNKEMTEKLWTNNNAESINHVFKSAVNWKPHSTPDLIEKLYNCVGTLFLHLRGCLHGHGDYLLVPSEGHYGISDQLWRCKTEDEKRKLFDSFLHDRRKKRKNVMVSSSNGKYSVINKAKSIAKKPCQRKRPRMERTEKR